MTTTNIIALPIGSVDTVLEQAADYLTRNGWIPTGLYDVHNGCTEKLPCRVTGAEKCWPVLTRRYPASILGAIRYAVFGIPRWYLSTADDEALHTYTAAVEWFNTYLLAIGHAGQHDSVFAWQTIPGRSTRQVSDALHAAATAYRRHHIRNAA